MELSSKHSILQLYNKRTESVFIVSLENANYNSLHRAIFIDKRNKAQLEKPD